jgi:hypothetical protein
MCSYRSERFQLRVEGRRGEDSSSEEEIKKKEGREKSQDETK